MNVINEIIKESAIGQTSVIYRRFILLLFATIVSALLAMLFLLLLHGSNTTIRFGYLYAI